SGTNAATATGTVAYKVYSDNKCTKEVARSEERRVGKELVPASKPETLANETYFWQASYSGDPSNEASKSQCSSEVETVSAKAPEPKPTTTTTSLSGEGKTAASESVKEGAVVVDTATISGTNAATATGTVAYKVYSDNKCTKEVASAGAVSVSGELVPVSNPQTLAPGTYFWQASYSGDPSNEPSKSQCSSEVETVSTKAPEPQPTTLTTSLSGEGKTGASISVKEGAAVTDTATISGVNAATATGTVTYKVYSDNECTKEVASAGAVSVSGELVPASNPETLAPGTYFWQASYSGDALNEPSESECGEEQLTVSK